MAFTPIRLAPGVNQQFTPALNQAGYWQAAFVRFKDHLAEKVGGWQRVTSTAAIGTVRGSHIWSDLTGSPYMANGSEQRLQVFEGGNVVDITPLRTTTNPAVAFTTVISTSSVTIHDSTHGASIGDWINVVVPVAVGGLIIQGYYLVQTVIDSDNYTITAASNATASVGPAGAVPAFTTTNGSPNILVTFAAHGLIAGSLFAIQVSLTLATVLISGTQAVIAPVTTNTFTIAPGGNANASLGPTSENSGNTQIQYLLPSGVATATTTSGYGAGDYGAGDYGGSANAGTVTPVREWFLDNWGQDLIGSYTNGPAYYWVPPTAAPATLVPNGPLYMTASFVSMPQQIFVALGAEVSGSQDPNLIRWTDVADFTVWTASALNQAGSFRLPTGSHIVGGFQAPNQGLIWTDIDLWAMSYVQPPFVFGFNKVAGECGLIGAMAFGLINNKVIWMSADRFIVMDSNGVNTLPCSVWDFVFKNLAVLQVAKIVCATNSLFNEIAWFFPSATGTGEIDSYVKFNVLENAWDCGSLVRTSWVDSSPLGAPIGLDGNGLMQQHDVAGVYDNDGIAMDAYWESGYFQLANGTEEIFIERIIPDFIWSATVGQAAPANATAMLTVLMTDYPAPNNPVQSFGPFPITPSTTQVIVRGRGRYAALKVEMTGLGVFLRVGEILHNGVQAGRRP